MWAARAGSGTIDIDLPGRRPFRMLLPKRAGVRPMPGRLVDYTLKLSPQEQDAFAFGLVNLKPPAMSLLEKSITVPFR